MSVFVAPTSESFAAALRPYLVSIPPVDLLDPWHSRGWLRNQLLPAVESQDVPRFAASLAVSRLQPICSTHDLWEQVCRLTWLRVNDPASERIADLEACLVDHPSLVDIVRGLAEAIADTRRLPADPVALGSADFPPGAVWVRGDVVEEPLTETAEALIHAGRAAGAEIAESPLDPLLQRLMTDHAAYMARVRRGGHQGVNRRLNEVISRWGNGARMGEIAAQSWRRQDGEPLSEIAAEMYRSWRQSSGHWSVASTRHDAIGCEMSRGRNGVWYAAMLAVDGINERIETDADNRLAQRPTLGAS